MYKIYGIKNCDTMKKAFNWLDEHKIHYQFYNYKTEGVSKVLLQGFIQQLGWQALLNTKGMTWRKLDEETRQKINIQDNHSEELAIQLMLDNPSIIKRPLLINEQNHTAILGFSPENYTQFTQESK